MIDIEVNPIQVEVVNLTDDLPLPTYQTAGAAGIDLYANIDYELQPRGGRAMIPTGLKMSIPDGYEMQVRPRSGLAAKHGISVINAPGTIDSDYRGEVCVILVNHGDTPFHVRRGERIAQGVFSKVYQLPLVEVETLTETVRGAGGFGSTG